MAEMVRVETKSAWLSKINWTQAVAMAASVIVLVTGGKIDIPIEVQTSLVIGIQAAQSIGTWVLKTWYTPTVTPASASPTGEKTLTID